MQHADFVHLHLHTNYSLLDGACQIKPLVERGAELRFPAMAITDHGNLFGAIEFYDQCMKAGIKPIIGCEAYMAPKGRTDRQGTGIRESNSHIVLLAKDEEGFANLMRLVTIGYLEGFYYKPRIDKETLRQYRKGLIVLTGCLKGVLNIYLAEDQFDLARKELDDYVQIMGKENVYVELHIHNMPLEDKTRAQLIRLAKEAGVSCIATNDVHYIEQKHAVAHDALIAIQTQTTLDDPHRMRYEQPQFYLKSAQEMRTLFKDIPEAVSATIEVAERCNLELETGRLRLPFYEPPKGRSQEDYLRELCYSGLKGRYGEENEELARRLEHELGVIKQAGYSSYFLIVWDFVRFAKVHGIPVGPGRGSAAGSLASYCLGITDIDPIKYDLLFERFLNPERVSQPDIDIDFCYERRNEVIDYVIGKYGKTNVAQIITFGTMQAKAVVRDVARVMRMSYGEADRLAKLIPYEPDMTLSRALSEVPELTQLYRNDERVRQLIDKAFVLEGLTRHASTHAAGITIADRPLTEYAPLFKSNDGQITTGFDMTSLERIGLLKIDMLGLRTLTVIDQAIKLVERRRDLVINIDTLPLDDAHTLELLSRAESMGVFQLESSGMRDLLKKIKPSQFEDIISVIALFRPGPIGSGMLDEFMKRKHGRIAIKYEHPRLEPILKSTYGVIVFQEQVMRIASDLAGFSLAQADILRRAMGKKKAEVMVAQRKAFIDGCKRNKISERHANRIFDLMEHFAGYGFNKCVVGDTEIVDAETGELVRVEDLYRSPRPMTTPSLDERLRVVKRPVRDVVSNGRKPVFKVTTRLGHSIRATGNHPFFTESGWKQIKDLKVGDFVASPRALKMGCRQEWVEPYRLVALAAMLSEGNTCQPSGVYVYNKNKTFIDDFVAHASRFDLTVPRVSERRGLYEAYAGTGRKTVFVKAHSPWNKGLSGYPRSGSHGSFQIAPRSGFRRWVEELGLAWVKSTDKFIPKVAFRLQDEQLVLFLGRLWSGDGHFYSDKVAAPVPFYATSSKRLARQLQYLLLRLRIVGVLKKKSFKHRGDVRIGYVVYMTGKEHILRFLDLLGPHVVGHDDSMRALRAYYESVESDQSSKDVLPASIKFLIRKEKDRVGITWRQLEKGSGCSAKELYGPIKAYKCGFRRSTIQRLGEYLESPELLRQATSDIYWDRIVSIETDGVEETYDLEVDDTHNFFGNGLFVHNSHSAAYAMISYRTAYLKAHYSVEFMAALLGSEMGNTDKLVLYLDEAKRMGIRILPPDVNESEASFTVIDDMTIRCGLGIIKNVGLLAIQSIIAAREARGRFHGIEELCRDVDLRLVNRKVCESLIKAGACDSMGRSRAALLALLDQAMEEATSIQKDRQRGQMTLFEELSTTTPAKGNSGAVPRDWPESQKLAFEKALLGFYVSGHPLARYEKILRVLSTTASEGLTQLEDGSAITLGGMLTKIKLTTTKKTNEQMAVCVLEDLAGDVEVLVFPNSYTQIAPQLKPNAVVFVEGRVALRDERPRIIAQQITPINQGPNKLIRSIELVLRDPADNERLLEQLKRLLSGSAGGEVPVLLQIKLSGQESPTRLRLAEGFRVNPTQEFLEALGDLLGEDAIVVRRHNQKTLPNGGARRSRSGRAVWLDKAADRMIT